MTRLLSLFALSVVALACTVSANAQTYKFSTLYSFKNNGSDPSLPTSLIIDGSGNLYGTSFYGGTHNNGAVFKVGPKGALKLLYSFNGSDSLNTANPINLARDSKGNLYGDTQANPKVSGGDLFKLTPSSNGNYTFSSLYVPQDSPTQ